jgi:hypothetical protein
MTASEFPKGFVASGFQTGGFSFVLLLCTNHLSLKWKKNVLRKISSALHLAYGFKNL